MAWGWETANIGQSKLSWVLLGFGEWMADKASPHTLGGTRLGESQKDGTGGGLRGGLLRFPPAPRGYVHLRRVPNLNFTTPLDFYTLF